MASEELARVVAANREKGGRHSPLYRWMRSHHDALAAAFETDGISWRAVTEMLAETGLTDGSGKPPAIRRAQKAWYQVKRDVAAARAKAEAKRKPCVSIPIAGAAPLPSPVPCEPGRPNEQPSDTQPTAATGAAAERLRAFRETLKAGRVRMPEPINPRKDNVEA